MAERYPSVFPLPQRDPYAFTADMGVIRTPMESGGPRQRRRYTNMPHYFSLEFVVPIAQLFQWQSWINTNAYIWFELPLVNWITTGAPLCSNYCLVRFTSDLTFSVATKDYLRVGVDAELAPGQVNTNPARYDWIIGGTPAAPSSLNWVIGGTPAVPSLEWVVSVL